MTNVRIECPHCSHALQIEQQNLGDEVECQACQKRFLSKVMKSDDDIPVTVVQTSKSKKVVGVTCVACQSRFGIKQKMAGRVLACPKCRARQRVELEFTDSSTSDPGKSDHDQASEHSSSTAKVVKQKGSQKGTQKATVVHSADNIQLPGVDAQDREKALALLPPKYVVPEQDQQVASQEPRTAQAPSFSLGIDTEKTRIQHGAETHEVETFSLDQKRRRRLIRTVIVFVVCVVLLVAVVLFLLQSLDVESDSAFRLLRPANS